MSERLTYNEAIELLERNGQPDILYNYSVLSAGDRANLLKQISEVDWDNINLVKRGIPKKTIGHLDPPDAVELSDIERNRNDYHKRGQFLLRAGKVAAVMLAGGMGTRLGAGKPKGEVNIGKSRNVYIYQCLIENLLTVVNMERAVVPLYIMTNEKYRKQTELFFKDHNYFGYPANLITFYTQDNNHCVDLNGDLFLDAPAHLASSPNGNGGWFQSMDKAGLLPDLERRGVEWINVFAVDNVLQKIADPLFVGAVALGRHDAGAKVVRKTGVFENVGVFCKQDGHPSVVEYYEMDDITKAEKDEYGQLKYRFGVILNYLFSVKKLREGLDSKFPVHVAKKKIPYMDIVGDIISPTEPNGYKFETLAADMVAMMKDCLCYEVIRSREFAPIKNATGEDSIETARKLLEANGVRL